MPKTKIQFTRHVFSTLTYSRDLPVESRWQTISRDFNRYIQTFRRQPDSSENPLVNYIRVIEKHKDGYPHIHAMLQFPSASIRVQNNRYFDRSLYAGWKTLWKHGHSDYQKPRKNGLGTLTYLLKYLLKNQTKKTVWKKVLLAGNVVPPVSTSIGLVDAYVNIPQNVVTKPISTNITWNTTKNTNPVSIGSVKLCTWSRHFDFSPFFHNSKN